MSSVKNLFTADTLDKIREAITVDDSFVVSLDDDYKFEVDVAKDRALISITDLYSNDQAAVEVDTEYFLKDYDVLLLDMNDLKDDLILYQSSDNLDRSIF